MARGRPPIDPAQKKTITVHLQLTAATYDRLWGKAERAGITVRELLAQTLERARISADSKLSAGASSAQNGGHAPGRCAPDD